MSVEFDCCSACNKIDNVTFKRYYSYKNDSFYFYSKQLNTGVWSPPALKLNYMCTYCVESVCELSWRKCQSKTTNEYYFYNNATNQSTTNRPFMTHPPDALDLIKSKRDIYTTPTHLEGKRNYFFKNLIDLHNNQRDSYQEMIQILPTAVEGFQIDEVASFSVSEANVANDITRLILKHCNNNANLVICDGMACVGGNTISFSYHFNTVISNEYDYKRYHMLIHNVRTVLSRKNVIYHNQSITDLVVMSEKVPNTNSDVNPHNVNNKPCEILFLDPEWGGVDYKSATKLRLKIADLSVEVFVINAMASNPSLQFIALKLPTNYDNENMEALCKANGYQYTLYTNLKKMTLTIISRT